MEAAGSAVENVGGNEKCESTEGLKILKVSFKKYVDQKTKYICCTSSPQVVLL